MAKAKRYRPNRAVRINPLKDKATISFHHEKLAGVAQRGEIQAHWEKVMDKIVRRLEKAISRGSIQATVKIKQ